MAPSSLPVSCDAYSAQLPASLPDPAAEIAMLRSELAAARGAARDFCRELHEAQWKLDDEIEARRDHLLRYNVLAAQIDELRTRQYAQAGEA